MMYGFGGMGMGLVGGLMMLLVWVAIVLLIVWAVRTYLAPRHAESDMPIAVLKRRYAAGEISQAEYDQTRRVLQGGDA